MSRRFFPIFILLGLLCWKASLAEGSLLVKVTPDHPGAPAALVVAPQGWRYLSGVQTYIVESEDDPALAALREEGRLEFEEPSTEIELASTPNDPLYEAQSWMYEEEGISALGAWDVVSGEEVTVAIIDTGVDQTHPDLAANLWRNSGEIPGNGIDDDHNGYVDDVAGYDFASRDANPADDNGHGTHLAGVIGAVGNNGIGVAGINWHVKMMPLKFTDARGLGNTALAVEAIDYAIQNGAQVINASWNVKLSDSGADGISALRNAIERAQAAGIFFVTAAGNGSGMGKDTDGDPVYPAGFDLPNMVGVASVNKVGDLATFSNYGAQSIQIAAPGVGIISTLPGGNYGVMSGTSVSAAFVSGAAAMLLSINPHLSPAQIRQVLLSGSTPDDQLSGFVTTGGRLNLDRSVQTAQNLSSMVTTHVTSQAAVPAPSAGGCSFVH